MVFGEPTPKQDLYGALGINRDADAAAIHRAYRRAAKKAHPDTGGSPEKFALVKLAADCLGDAGRRARYDATGDVGEKEIDNLETNAINIAMQCIMEVATKIAQMGRDPETYDIVGDAVKNAKQKMLANAQNIVGAENEQSRRRRLAGRFKAKKDKKNRIREFLEVEANRLGAQIEQLKTQDKTLKRAIEILNEHEFAYEATQIGW